MSNSKSPLVDRFGPDAADVEFGGDAPSLLSQLAARGSVRKFRSDTIPYPTMRRLCALALCAPTKSDLQQRDIIIIDAPPLKSQIGALLADGPLGQKWLADVPNFLLFCGNNGDSAESMRCATGISPTITSMPSSTLRSMPRSPCLPS